MFNFINKGNKTYKLSRIKKIDITGLYYLDENLKESFIDFSLCRENWINYVMDSKEYCNLNRNPIKKLSPLTSHYVGKRNWFTQKPYYIFYGDEKIRFEIELKKKFFDFFHPHWRERYLAAFTWVEEQINANGWKTFDIS